MAPCWGATRESRHGETQNLGINRTCVESTGERYQVDAPRSMANEWTPSHGKYSINNTYICTMGTKITCKCTVYRYSSDDIIITTHNRSNTTMCPGHLQFFTLKKTSASWSKRWQGFFSPFQVYFKLAPENVWTFQDLCQLSTAGYTLYIAMSLYQMIAHSLSLQHLSFSQHRLVREVHNRGWVRLLLAFLFAFYQGSNNLFNWKCTVLG